VTAEWRGSGRVDLAGLLFNPGARRRALALHGWLDNAMSFAGLAAELPDWELLALDFAGHGESAHLPEGGWYHFIDYLDDVVTALQDRPIDLLIGHSLGGAVATAWAAARPATVPRLALIEALGPLAGAPNTAVSALRQGLSERRAIAAKQLRRFSDPQQAIVARLSANRMQQASAAALIRRGLRRAGEGWVWASDPRLTVASPWRLCETAIQHWIAAVEAPTLVIAADHAPAYFRPDVRESRLSRLRDGRVVVLPGHHHLHMDSPLPVAAAIRNFIAAHDSD
jgi:pimeloyl-ACP methyl ester carboxylesterase